MDRKGAVWFRPPETGVQLPLTPARLEPDDDPQDDPYWDRWGLDAEDVARVINEACARARRLREEHSPSSNTLGQALPDTGPEDVPGK